MVTSNNSDRGLIASPKYERLRKRYSLYIEEMTLLLEEREFLLKTQKPNLLADYQLKLGYKELELYHIRVAALRIKRKIELIQSCLNQDRMPDMEEIEDILDQEFAEWAERIRQKKKEIDRAERRFKMGFLSVEETCELRKLYRKLAKKLHPDLNPDQSPEEEVLWLKIMEAYNNKNWEEFKTLALLVENLNQLEEVQDSIEQLKNKCQELKKRIIELSKIIQKILSRFPFNIKEELHDEKWLNSRKKELDKKIAQWEKRHFFYLEYLNSILSGNIDGSIILEGKKDQKNICH